MRHASRPIALSLLGLLAALHVGSGSVTAQTQACQYNLSYPGAINAPIVLNQQGVHCLVTDITTVPGFTTFSAIDIQANNVILDLNGHKVGGSAAGPGTGAFGIRGTSRKNITIKNGTVRGFYQGIYLDDVPPFTTSQGHRVEGIRADLNTAGGIEVHGQGNVIRGNTVVSTGGSSSPTNAYGIVVKGAGAQILDNSVFETTGTPGSYSYGIYVDSSEASVVEGNRIGNVGTSPVLSVAIQIVNSSYGVLLSSNRIQRWNDGIRVDASSASGGTTKCRDNFFTLIIALNMNGCTDSGGNI